MSRTLERFSIVFLAFIGYTVMDILAQPLFPLDYHAYFAVWQVGLATLSITIGFAYRSVTLPLALVLMAHNGAEDFFYFILQLQMPPANLPWLTSQLVLQPASNLSTLVGAIWGISLLAFVSKTRIPLKINIH